MTKNIFFISDTHFGHEGVCNFLRKDGVTKLRPFSCAQEMDEVLVQNWNSVVKPGDRVYHLGDVAMKKVHLSTVDRCNGKKVLVKGNHDIFEAKEYLKYFEDIRGVYVLPARDGILSHIPLHNESVTRFKVNIHGHLHEGEIHDPHYFSVCCENINYTPIAYEDLKLRIKQKREALGYV